jgi:hypothetical protein
MKGPLWDLVVNLSHYGVLRRIFDIRITAENVNQHIVHWDEDIQVAHTWLELVDYGEFPVEMVVRATRCLLELGATVTVSSLTNVAPIDAFHLMLQYAEYPFNIYEENRSIFRHFLSSERFTLLLEYGAPVPKVMTELDKAKLLRIKTRMENCRRALMTLIWLAPTGLKSLFISWSKWIWSAKPYTNDLHPSIGPRSIVWENL